MAMEYAGCHRPVARVEGEEFAVGEGLDKVGEEPLPGRARPGIRMIRGVGFDLDCVQHVVPLITEQAVKMPGEQRRVKRDLKRDEVGRRDGAELHEVMASACPGVAERPSQCRIEALVQEPPACPGVDVAEDWRLAHKSPCDIGRGWDLNC